MTKAVFLDRDGVLNVKRNDYVKDLGELQILPDISKAIKKLNGWGYLVFIITNQSIINRKIISQQKLEQINEFLLSNISKGGAKVEKIYYCPHRPDENCVCRKPSPGLLFQAIKEYEISPSKSIFIGDDWTDIEAAKQANVRGLKIETNGDLLEFINNNLLNGD